MTNQYGQYGKRKFGKIVICGLGMSLFFTAGAFAQETRGSRTVPPAPAVDEQVLPPSPTGLALPGMGKKTEEAAPAVKESIKTGVVASFGKTSRNVAIDSGADGAVPGDEASAVSAGIRQVKRGQCEVTLTNSSKISSASVSYVAQGFNEHGTSAFRNSGSARIEPGKSVTKSVSCPSAQSMQVSINSGKLTPVKK